VNQQLYIPVEQDYNGIKIIRTVTRFALNQDNAPVQKAISVRHRLADEGNIKMDHQEVGWVHGLD
jgi:hypothetical protein